MSKGQGKGGWSGERELAMPREGGREGGREGERKGERERERKKQKDKNERAK